ncbi:hypothetical protein [Alkalibacter saccharofermentans]|uniref:ComK protein n=1 Tax=Alkalibacter saccharofermentans DSM 14828 TaxID=1120975 RepID=A0A1M4WNG4_9FIRM|nr:hypothetical protein [Alkalibacter saccharofermentans]SHE82841.1 ComK protein [Alkalibacter saccharofermentans DSM 14828]
MKPNFFEKRSIKPQDTLCLIPIYGKNGGNATKLKVGEITIVVKNALPTILKQYYKLYSINADYIKERVCQYTNQKSLSTIPITPEIILMPFKYRKPVSNDSVYGYVNIKQIQSIESHEDPEFKSKIKFHNKSDILSRQSLKSLNENLIKAKMLEGCFFEQQQRDNKITPRLLMEIFQEVYRS